MLVINDHGIETIEDVLWVFEPDEVELHYESYGEKNTGIHKTWWVILNGYEAIAFVEVEYYDNQKNDFKIWYKLRPNHDMLECRHESIEEVAGMVWKWHDIHKPAKHFAISTQPPPAFHDLP